MSRKRQLWITVKKKETYPNWNFLVRYFLLKNARESARKFFLHMKFFRRFIL